MSWMDTLNIEPYNPYRFNEYYLEEIEEFTAKTGNKGVRLSFKTTDENNDYSAVFMIDPETGKPYSFALRDMSRIAEKFDNSGTKTFAQIFQEAIKNKTTIWIRCQLDGKYLAIEKITKDKPPEKILQQESKPANQPDFSDDDENLPF